MLVQDVRLGATHLQDLDMAGCGKLARLAMPLLEAPVAQLRAAAEAVPKVRGTRSRALTCLMALRCNWQRSSLQAACDLTTSFSHADWQVKVQDRACLCT